MGIEWTDRQKLVIERRDQDLLVAAAAGSGKTAVLVEHIAAMLTDPEHPVDVQRLLVVTFTNAAAAEMRDRIGRRIDEALALRPSDGFLRRQRDNLHFAHISTIHSLCLQLIRDHFDQLDIDPSFRTGDESELKLLRQEVAEDVMEMAYASGNSDFRRFTSAYAKGKVDNGIIQMILNIYNFAQGQPSPEAWLSHCSRLYTPAYAGKIREELRKKTVKNGQAMALYQLRRLMSLRDWARQLTPSDQKDKLDAVLYSDLDFFQSLLRLDDVESLSAATDNISWARMPSLRNLTGDAAAYKDRLADIRKSCKEAVKRYRAADLDPGINRLEEEMAFTAPFISVLATLTDMFSRQYHQAKLDRNIIDFSDQEHYALKLLAEFKEDENGVIRPVPTRLADQYSEYFAEVICDEYQDSNPVQEMILSLLSAGRHGRHNRFMVGDVKQSIYGFRLADASIFLKKYEDYKDVLKDAGKALSVRLDLNQNFRSRAQVLESINYCFRQLMTGEFGEILYDEGQALYPGAPFAEDPSARVRPESEMLLADYDKGALEDADLPLTEIEMEGYMIADRIKELMDPVKGLDIYDQKEKAYRPLKYGDIVILLRTMKGWSEQLAQTLTDSGIPVTAEISEGFFSATEVRTMVALLTVIDNPRQDIPLAAVLLSPLGGVLDEDLAAARALYPKDSLYDLICHEDLPGEAAARIRDFLEKLGKLRKASRYMTLPELLMYIYELTGYYDYVQAMPQGARRRANLDMLSNKAEAYSQSSMTGLFDFVRYLEQMKENEIDFGEASVSVPGEGSVRIMSIHKSKGLEFPVVILAGMGKQFNMQDMTSSMILHADLGIGLDVISPETRRKKTGIYKKYIAGRRRLAALAEELRILYVAMTRAREKLILTGRCSGVTDKLAAWAELPPDPETPLPAAFLEEAKRPLDWIMPCLLRGTKPVYHGLDTETIPTGSPVFGLKVVSVNYQIIRRLAQLQAQAGETGEGGERKAYEAGDADEMLARQLDQDKMWQYSREPLRSFKKKYSVSELKKAYMEEQGEAAQVYAVKADPGTEGERRGQGMARAAARGTAYHRVMELLDMGHAPEKGLKSWVLDQMEAMCRSGRLSAGQRQMIMERPIVRFLKSDLGRRMRRAAAEGRLYKETPFILGIPLSELQMGDEKVLQAFPDRAIIQGVIDAWFVEDGRLVIVDYKTDIVPLEGGGQVLAARYRRQLDYYALALNKMTHEPVGERILYSLHLNGSVMV